MAYPIEDKLVIAIASTALFDLKESDAIFYDKGLEEYQYANGPTKPSHSARG